MWVNRGQLAGRETGENKARSASPSQVCKMTTVKGQNLFVLIKDWNFLFKIKKTNISQIGV